MGVFAAGQVVLAPFPFSDLSAQKLRPVLLLASAGRQDWVACQITSNPYSDAHPITLAASAFAEGGLMHTSFARPAKLSTLHESLIVQTLGSLNEEMLNIIRTSVIAVIEGVYQL